MARYFDRDPTMTSNPTDGQAGREGAAGRAGASEDPDRTRHRRR
jgi:hypothetical protein